MSLVRHFTHLRMPSEATDDKRTIGKWVKGEELHLSMDRPKVAIKVDSTRTTDVIVLLVIAVLVANGTTSTGEWNEGKYIYIFLYVWILNHIIIIITYETYSTDVRMWKITRNAINNEVDNLNLCNCGYIASQFGV